METIIDILSEKEKKVLNHLLDNPTTEFHLRGLSRKTKISHTWVKKSLIKLKKANLITIKKERELKIKANRENDLFKTIKRANNLIKLESSGLVEYLIEKFTHPDAIILFGSYSKGEDIEKSDIDLAIITEKNEEGLNLDKFFKNLKRTISVHLYKELNEETKKSVQNGIVLRGFME